MGENGAGTCGVQEVGFAGSCSLSNPVPEFCCRAAAAPGVPIDGDALRLKNPIEIFPADEKYRPSSV